MVKSASWSRSRAISNKTRPRSKIASRLLRCNFGLISSEKEELQIRISKTSFVKQTTRIFQLDIPNRANLAGKLIFESFVEHTRLWLFDGTTNHDDENRCSGKATLWAQKVNASALPTFTQSIPRTTVRTLESTRSPSYVHVCTSPAISREH